MSSSFRKLDVQKLPVLVMVNKAVAQKGMRRKRLATPRVMGPVEQINPIGIV